MDFGMQTASVILNGNQLSLYLLLEVGFFQIGCDDEKEP